MYLRGHHIKGDGNPFRGKKHTKEIREKLSIINKARLKDKRNHPMYGKKHTVESKEKMSESHKGIKHKIETKKIISLKLKGKKKTEKHKYNIKKNHVRPMLNRIGEMSGHWKGGLTPQNEIIRGSLRMREWKNRVFEKDNYICQDCGYDKGGILNAHHILSFSLYPEFRFNADNGITLCKECHIKAHKKIL